jgi:hypothetical protein
MYFEFDKGNQVFGKVFITNTWNQRRNGRPEANVPIS